MKPSLANKVLGKAADALAVLRAGGVGALIKYVRFLRNNARDRRNYLRWMNGPGKVDRVRLSTELQDLSRQPLISVIVPVYNTDEKWLRRCLESVSDQIYPNWELCIADDASTEPDVRPVLEKYAARDERIKLTFREQNGHISAASNSALELASGEFVVLLDHDDELSPDALYYVARVLNDHPDTAMIYSDEDLIDESGRRQDPKFKPDFSRDLLYSTNLVTHLSGYRTDLLRQIGGFRIGFEGSQDYDLALRAIEQIDGSQIRHIPHILYHWRTIKGSVAFSMDEKPYAHERARKAIREHLERTGHSVEVLEGPHYLHRVRYTAPKPTVSLIVSINDEFESISGLVDPECQQIHVARDRDHVSDLNEAAKNAEGDVLIFLDAGLSVRTVGGLADLASFAIQPGIGAVGGKILSRGYLVEQAGLILQHDGVPVGAHQDFPHDTPGNLSRNLLTANFSAIAISCMAIAREKFESIGGFDTDAGEMFDVDICLRLRGSNERIVVAPHVLFKRRGPRPQRKLTAECLKRFRERWPEYVEHDPFCNPNLTRDGKFRIKL